MKKKKDAVGWDRSIELLLSNWSMQISLNEAEYRKRATRYNRMYYAIGAFSIITQTVSLSTLLNIIVYQLYTNIIIVCAILDSLLLIVQTLDKFFNFGGGVELYFEAAKAHNALRSLIDSTLILRRDDRGDAKKILTSIREEFNKLKADSPPLPHNKVIHKLDMCIYEDPKEAIGNTKEVTSHAYGLLFNERDDEKCTSSDKLEFRKKIAHEKLKSSVTLDPVVRNPILKNLDYQWQRMQQHTDTNV